MRLRVGINNNDNNDDNLVGVHELLMEDLGRNNNNNNNNNANHGNNNINNNNDNSHENKDSSQTPLALALNTTSFGRTDDAESYDEIVRLLRSAMMSW